MRQELKTGHQCIAWDRNASVSEKGIYLYNDKCNYANHFILIDGEVVPFDNAELDPDADKFLPGDKVEVSNCGIHWYKRNYIGPIESRHIVKTKNLDNAEVFDLCRYPHKKTVNIELEGKSYLLDVDSEILDKFKEIVKAVLGKV